MASVRHLTTEELAARLGVEPRTVEDWRLDGIGPPFIRLGKGGPKSAVRYRERDVEPWEESRLVTPGTT